MKKRLLGSMIIISFILTGCYIVPVQEDPPPPEPIQWRLVTLRAIGQGAPPAKATNAAQARLLAERAAKMDAYRNLLERAYGLNISSRTYVRDFITKSDSIKGRVDAYIRGAKIVHTIQHDDGGVEVEMEITLRQDFRQIFPMDIQE